MKKYFVLFLFVTIIFALSHSETIVIRKTDNTTIILNTNDIQSIEFTGVGIKNLVKFQKLLNFAKNYPNPFNPITTISFKLESSAITEVSIFNVNGQKIRNLVNNQKLDSGEHKFIWDGKDENGNLVSSGVYFYKVKADNNEITNKMLLIK